MKKFTFPLDTVLGYKEQVLDIKLSEHGKALSAVNEQEEIITKLLEEYEGHQKKFKERSALGVTIVEALGYEAYMSFLGDRIKQEKYKLDDLKRIEESMREEVVEAKIETSTIEKLKERKKEEYDKLVQKNEELFIEEFVSNKMASIS
ncbi:MAG: flagellar export protein FliJ [Peptostreptococcaceae bacterium]|nr:flagellar export protein FliJ [Peptostreptococcaceae bacterium]